MSPLVVSFVWICLAWVLVMSTLLFVLEAMDFRRHEAMRRKWERSMRRAK